MNITRGRPFFRPLTSALAAALVAACGGGGDAGGGTPPPAVTPTAGPRVSQITLVANGCTGGSVGGTVYSSAEVEPFVAADPADADHLVGAWQQDRWSNGGSRALVSAVSFDGGRRWERVLHPMSRCGGAAAGSSGDYERATDPWVDIGADGNVHVVSVSFNGGAFTPGSVSAVLASRSTDGGRSFSAPATLIRDDASFFNDKETLTADPTDTRFVYTVWDRLETSGQGPTMMARSINGGSSWQAAREIYRPVSSSLTPASIQTIGNRIVVIPGGASRGMLVNVFTEIDSPTATQSIATVRVIRSTNHGATWSAPVSVGDWLGVGTTAPQTGQAIRDGNILPAIAAAPNGDLWVAWQDARFSRGQHDGIVLSRSTDAGATWSAPVLVNHDPAVAAFTPTLHVRSDGVLGILHYDFRLDTAAADSLFAAAWLITTRDGVNLSETPVGERFDMSQAPDANGLFLGDYTGLVSVGETMVTFATTAQRNTANRTDVYAYRITPTLAARAATSHRARSLGGPWLRPSSDAQANDARLRERSSRALAQAMEQRIPGWRGLRPR